MSEGVGWASAIYAGSSQRGPFTCYSSNHEELADLITARKDTMPRFYHFTSEVALRQILRLGAILPGESNVGSPSGAMEPHGDHLGPDVVWLLDDPQRPVAKRGHPSNHGLFGCIPDKTTIRITVDVKAIPWFSWAAAEAMNPLWRKMFVQAGGGEDAAKHWYVVPAAIRSRHWAAIDRVDGQPLDLAEQYDEQEGVEPCR